MLEYYDWDLGIKVKWWGKGVVKMFLKIEISLILRLSWEMDLVGNFEQFAKSFFLFQKLSSSLKIKLKNFRPFPELLQFLW